MIKLHWFSIIGFILVLFGTAFLATVISEDISPFWSILAGTSWWSGISLLRRGYKKEA